MIMITRENIGIILETTLKDNFKKPIDLTGLSVEVAFIDPNNNLSHKTAIIIDALNGKATVYLDFDVTSISGLWKTYWTIIGEDFENTAQKEILYFVLDEYGGATV